MTRDVTQKQSQYCKLEIITFLTLRFTLLSLLLEKKYLPLPKIFRATQAEIVRFQTKVSALDFPLLTTVKKKIIITRV